MTRRLHYALLCFFLFAPAGCKISGQVTGEGIGAPGITLRLTGDEERITRTDDQGNYSFDNLKPGAYEVTPLVFGHTFGPEHSAVSISSGYLPATGVDFEIIDVSPVQNRFGMTFNPLLAGTFMMGSPTDEIGRFDDEIRHPVTLTESFGMQTTEVTQHQWESVVLEAQEKGILAPGELEAEPSFFKECGPDCPVEYISWDEIQVFIRALNRLGEGTYQLPSEAQWEYAARAGSSTSLPNGELTEKWCDYDPVLDEIGWYCNNSGNKTQPVAQKKANAWGLFDMQGNVREWCEDWYAMYPLWPVTNPYGPLYGTLRTNRGGGWAYTAVYCRSANRVAYIPEGKHYFIGFRLVKLL